MALPIIEILETIPTKYKNTTNPRTQGINIKPKKNVTDPQSMSESEIPRSREANPAGVMLWKERASHLRRGAAVGGERMMFKTRAESSYKTLDW